MLFVVAVGGELLLKGMLEVVVAVVVLAPIPLDHLFIDE